MHFTDVIIVKRMPPVPPCLTLCPTIRVTRYTPYTPYNIISKTVRVIFTLYVRGVHTPPISSKTCVVAESQSAIMIGDREQVVQFAFGRPVLFSLLSSTKLIKKVKCNKREKFDFVIHKHCFGHKTVTFVLPSLVTCWEIYSEDKWSYKRVWQ